MTKEEFCVRLKELNLTQKDFADDCKKDKELFNSYVKPGLCNRKISI